jgi:hypothetical protein
MILKTKPYTMLLMKDILKAFWPARGLVQAFRMID